MNASVLRRAATTISVIAGALLIAAGKPAHSQERPFEPLFEVSSARRSAGEPTQVQIYFQLEEGHAFPSKAVFEIPAEYQIPRGSEVPNGDIVGDGVVTIKAGPLGVQTVNVCVSNKNPPSDDDWVTLNVAVQLGGGQAGGCSGILNLTLSLRRRGEAGPYTAAFQLPTSGGFGLDTPLKLTVNLFGISRPDPQSIPPAPGGAEVLKNPETPGIYEWKLTVEDPAGRVRALSQPQRIDQPPPRPREAGRDVTRWAALIGGVLGGAALIALLVVAGRRKARKIYDEAAAELADLEKGYEYYDERGDAGVAAGDRSRPGSPI